MPHLPTLLRRLPVPALVASLAVAALVTWLLCWRPFSAEEAPAQKYSVECLVTSAQAGSVGARIDEGHGIAMQHPAPYIASFAASAAPVLVSLPLPPGRVRAVRLSFFTTPVLTLSTLRLRAPDGAILATCDLAQAKAVNNTVATSTEGEVSLRSPAGGYLGLVAPLPAPLLIPSGNEPGGLEVLSTFAAAAGLLGLLGHLCAGRLAALAVLGEAFGARASRSPVLTLGVVALLASLFSCAPVVFGGRSFVAPANGAPLLYFGTPTLPGAPVEVQEDPKGTDMAAMVWQNLPYSAVQHRALFRDGEWPLWNRDNGGGVPLLGQGLSMLGDPLHGLPVLAGGAAWAWDAKFLLAKALFALGLGLCAWHATRELGVAALVAASSAWIGFFAFRFNHPAFFSVCYAPWILLPWLAIRRAEDWRAHCGWAAALVLADIMELTSGTVKEPSMLLLFLNATGLLAVAWQRAPRSARGRQIAILTWASLLFLLLSAPSWLLFVDALRQAATISEVPVAFQQQPGLLLGFFDEIFSQDFTKLEQHTHPSTNALVLCGLLWLGASWRRHVAERTAPALAAGALLPLLLAYGVISPQWITALPFIGKIGHIDNVFDCVLVVLCPVLAALGLAECCRAAPDPEWRRRSRRALVLGGLLLLTYLGFTQALPQYETFGFKLDPPLHSRFYLAYAPALLGAVLLLPHALRWLRLPGTRLAGLGVLAVCLVVLHFRHGMYTATKFDGYVMNPKTGMDLVAQSPALDRVRRRLAEPYRTFGFGYTLSAGYQALLGLEGICGPDPLANREYRELCQVAELPLDYDWRIRIDEATLPRFQRLYDLLNLRFYLREGGGASPAGLALVGRADLQIFESKTAWPRAFYTSEVGSYQTAAEFVQMVASGDGRPFAARQETTAGASIPAGRLVDPARDYRLTSNSTTFTITAPAAGVVVLAENYEEGNFQLTVNGAPSPYFRVNHMYKGLALPGAGTYRIRYTYLPRLFHLSLALAGIGLFLGALTPFTPRLLQHK